MGHLNLAAKHKRRRKKKRRIDSLITIKGKEGPKSN